MIGVVEMYKIGDKIVLFLLKLLLYDEKKFDLDLITALHLPRVFKIIIISQKRFVFYVYY